MSFLLVAKARNGTTMIPAPIDHGMWREPIERASQELVAQHPSSGSNGKIEIWVMGTVSPLVWLQLKERGIDVKEHVDMQITFMD